MTVAVTACAAPFGGQMTQRTGSTNAKNLLSARIAELLLMSPGGLCAGSSKCLLVATTDGARCTAVFMTRVEHYCTFSDTVVVCARLPEVPVIVTV